MTEKPHSLDYNATINRMEFGIAPVDTMVPLASIAISLKRIADMMEDPYSEFNSNIRYSASSAAELVRSAIQQHDTKVAIAR